MNTKLSTTDHNRDVAGLKYVYPVLSRRSGGLSIGINFNVNNACNWRCIYCQVPDLIRGNAPEIDLVLLKKEITFFLKEVTHGNFYDNYQVDPSQRKIRDIAISGNGEPTSAPGFEQAVSLIGEMMDKAGIGSSANYILITNGSLMHQKKVQSGLKRLRENRGRVWFKLDSATREGRSRINQSAVSQERSLENLVISASLCPTWLQTCLFMQDEKGWLEQERQAYLEFLREIKNRVFLEGVLLYTIARPSMQPEADRLANIAEDKLYQFAKEIESLGFMVTVSG